MSQAVDYALVRDIASAGVKRIAPGELPVFGVVAEAYLADPKAAWRRRRDRPGELEFGLGDIVVVVSPIAMAVAAEVVTSLTSDAVKGASKRGVAAVVRRVRRLFRRGGAVAPTKPVRALELTGDDYAEIRQIALETAIKCGLPEGKAELLADAVVGRLVAVRTEPAHDHN